MTSKTIAPYEGAYSVIDIHEGFVIIRLQQEGTRLEAVLSNAVDIALNRIRPTMWRLLFIDVSKVEVLNEELKAMLVSLHRVAQKAQAQAMICGANTNLTNQLANERMCMNFRHFSSLLHAQESWLL